MLSEGCSLTIAECACLFYKVPNATLFTHFWLSEMTSSRREEMSNLEGSVLLDEFGLVFNVSSVYHTHPDSASPHTAAQQDASSPPSIKDFERFRAAVFSEFPNDILSEEGAGMSQYVISQKIDVPPSLSIHSSSVYL